MKKFILSLIFINTIFMLIGISIGTASADLNNGLVAYYPFNSNANDESGNGNHGAVYEATLTEDRFGEANSAYSFDGVNSYITVPDHDSLYSSVGLTITAWIKSNDTSGARAIVTKWNENTKEWSYNLKDHNYSDKLRISLSKGDHMDLADLSGNNSIKLGEWIFVAVTYDCNILNLYFNAIEDASLLVTGIINDSAAELVIGAGYAWGTIIEHFSGVIDDVRIYNRALSETEIQELYKIEEAIPCDLTPVLDALDVIESKLDTLPSERGTDGASTHIPVDVDAVIEDEEINNKLDALSTQIEALKGIIQQLSVDMSEIKTKLNTGEVITQKDLAPGQGGVYFMGAQKRSKPDNLIKGQQGKKK